MFKLQLAQYINEGLVRCNMTYKDLERESGVPKTTLSYYARGQVNTPNDDYCNRIAAAFGDGPEVVQKMRRDALASTTEENKLIAESNDKERMERFIALMRSNMVAILEEYRIQAASQQTEIIQHADKRIEDERARFKQRTEEVVRQCNEEIAKSKAHNAEMMKIKNDLSEKGEEENARVRSYLKRIIRNLSIALIAVSLFSALGLSVFGGYAFFAYHTFDREDPTRGLYREYTTPEPTNTPSPILIQ